MPEKIYQSSEPPIPLVRSSIWTLLFKNDIYPSSMNDSAFIDAITGTSYTRGELRDFTLQLAWGMRNHIPKLGGPVLTRGSTIMIFSPNNLAWPILLFGGLAAGFKCTLANSSYTPHELAHQWKDSGAQLICVHPALLQVSLDMFKIFGISPEDAKKRIVIASYGPGDDIPAGYTALIDLLGKGALQHEEKFNGEDSNETALLCYSSGTTGKPKGVETSHYNVTSNMLMTVAWHTILVHGKDVTIGILPFYHIYGAIEILHLGYYNAVPVVLMAKFDPDLFCKMIERYKVTTVSLVPPILLTLTHHPATNKYNMTSLSVLYSGAAPLGGPLVVAVQNKLKSVGASVVVGQGYGLTETSPMIHLLRPRDSERKFGSVGQLITNLEVRLVDESEDEGEVVDAKEGEPGELWVRGPSIMKGYLNNESATKNAITPDGWFKTGDVCIRDSEGFYFVVDRKKELIKYKGFQVPPAELESVLLQHPDIIDTAVIGVDSAEEATELPRGYVVTSKLLKTDEEKAAFGRQVQKWIQTKVAKHKFLRGGVIVTDVIPKSTAGKILRKELRALAKREFVDKARSKL